MVDRPLCRPTAGETPEDSESDSHRGHRQQPGVSRPLADDRALVFENLARATVAIRRPRTSPSHCNQHQQSASQPVGESRSPVNILLTARFPKLLSKRETSVSTGECSGIIGLGIPKRNGEFRHDQNPGVTDFDNAVRRYHSSVYGAVTSSRMEAWLPSHHDSWTHQASPHPIDPAELPEHPRTVCSVRSLREPLK